MGWNCDEFKYFNLSQFQLFGFKNRFIDILEDFFIYKKLWNNYIQSWLKDSNYLAVCFGYSNDEKRQ